MFPAKPNFRIFRYFPAKPNFRIFRIFPYFSGKAKFPYFSAFFRMRTNSDPYKIGLQPRPPSRKRLAFFFRGGRPPFESSLLKKKKWRANGQTVYRRQKRTRRVPFSMSSNARPPQSAAAAAQHTHTHTHTRARAAGAFGYLLGVTPYLLLLVENRSASVLLFGFALRRIVVREYPPNCGPRE